MKTIILKIFVFLTIIALNTHAASLGQFGSRPLYLVDTCTNTINGYSKVTSSSNTIDGLFVQATGKSIKEMSSNILLCISNTKYITIANEVTATNCLTDSGKVCLFRNDNY